VENESANVENFFSCESEGRSYKGRFGSVTIIACGKVVENFYKKFPNKKIMGWVGHYHRHFGFGIPKKKAGVENFFYPHPVLKTCL
jgi:hypothetical protein